jgi:MYXO-CTERM domain-containing protein
VSRAIVPVIALAALVLAGGIVVVALDGDGAVDDEIAAPEPQPNRQVSGDGEPLTDDEAEEGRGEDEADDAPSGEADDAPSGEADDPPSGEADDTPSGGGEDAPAGTGDADEAPADGTDAQADGADTMPGDEDVEVESNDVERDADDEVTAQDTEDATDGVDEQDRAPGDDEDADPSGSLPETGDTASPMAALLLAGAALLGARRRETAPVLDRHPVDGRR